jgi:lipid II:glycine glycyltransferase (peptidoglycan interpeptide bridge formation enzyme)
MEIREIKNKEVWEDFLSGVEEKTFLSSWNWGEFQRSMGSGSNGKIWRFGIFDRSELVSVALTIKVVARRGTFLLVPHGPNIKSKIRSQKSKILETLSQRLKEMAIGEKADFIRINPILERSRENEEIFEKLKFRQAPVHAHPEASWKLDLSLSEDRLLGQMRKTTRYLIKQAQKDKDIEIYQGKELKDVEIFNKIHLEVVRVQKFIPFSLDYFRKEFSAFSQDDEICIFFARYKGEIAAASYVIFWSGVGFYHHAALLPEFHKIPLAYALQWESIREAKRRGSKLYDFWGYVNPQENPEHPWAGPTLFKMGFGGRAYEYVKTQDFPISKKYWLTYFFEKLRKIKRGYN